MEGSDEASTLLRHQLAALGLRVELAERQAERTSLTSGPLPRGDPTAERPLRLSLSWVGGREGQIGEAQMQIMNFSVQRVHERDTYGEGEGSERVTI